MPNRKTNPKTFAILAMVAAVFAASFLLRHFLQEPQPNTTAAPTQGKHHYQRIIGLSPSIVEIIYQLKQQDRLVGISRFCQYPPEAKEKPTVGGYIDLDFEAMLALRPDCVVLLEEQRQLAEKLESMGIHTIILDHASTTGVIDSITTLGKALQQEPLAGSIVQSIQHRLNAVTHEAKKITHPPRVLVCIQRDTDSSFPDRVIAAGNKGVHQEYINLTGAQNAYQGPVAFPMLSREKLIHLNPDIIIELVREDVWEEKGRDTLTRQWQQFGELKAVQNHRIIFLHEHKHMIPGPRFIDTLEVFAQAVQQQDR